MAGVNAVGPARAVAGAATAQRETELFGNRGVCIFSSPRREFGFGLRTAPAKFLARLFVSGLFPGGATIGSFVADVVGRVPNGGMLGIGGVNATQIAGDRSADPGPVGASIGGEQECSGFPGEPADPRGRRETRRKIRIRAGVQ